MTTLRKIIVLLKSIQDIGREEREVKKAIREKGLEQFLKEYKQESKRIYS